MTERSTLLSSVQQQVVLDADSERRAPLTGHTQNHRVPDEPDIRLNPRIPMLQGDNSESRVATTEVEQDVWETALESLTSAENV